MITLRLDPELEQTVSRAAKNLGLSRSELIRRSLVEYIARIEGPNAWEVGRDLFGKYSSGQDNLSSDRKAIVRRKIEAKRT